MPNTNKRVFACHELEPSAFLWARGVPFLGVEASPTTRSPNHVVFTFDDSNESCQRELLAYEAGAKVPARQFALALRALKSEILGK